MISSRKRATIHCFHEKRSADSRRLTHSASSILVMVPCLLSSSVAAAQGATPGTFDPFSGVEEMIVTGTPTEDVLVPTNVSAVTFDADALMALGVSDVSDLDAFVPNLEIRSENATNASFFVRGVGLQDFGANAQSAVPIIQDGVVRNPSATQLVGLFDVGGLSVLRGPQGSGNFRNASAGAIVINTRKPEPEFSGYAQTTLATLYSVDSVDAPRYKFESGVSAPIYEDIVSARLSARYSRERPYVENNCGNRTPLEGRPRARFQGDASVVLCKGLTAVDGSGRVVTVGSESVSINEVSQVAPFLSSKLGQVDDYGFRAQLRVTPPDSGVDTVLRGEISHLARDSVVGAHIGTGAGLGGLDSGGYRDTDITRRVLAFQANGLTQAQALAAVGRQLLKNRGDSHPYRVSVDSPGHTNVETISITQTTTVDLELFDVEFNAGYLDYRKSERRDTDLSPNVRFPSSGDDQAWEFFADGHLSGEQPFDLPMTWKTGGWVFLENVESFQEQDIFDIQVRKTRFDQETYGFGIFFETEYELTEQFSFAGGVRYNWERKGFEAIQRTITGQPPQQIELDPLASENQLTWDAFTGFAELRYAFTEDVNTYLRYSRGFKAGHFNASRPDKANVEGVGFANPESIDAVEWGVNSAFWDGRVRGYGTLFFYNYRNYQVFRLTSTFGGVFREIQNANQARNLGAEIGLTLTPLEGFVPAAVEGLSMKIEGGWLRTEFVDFVNFDLFQAGGNRQINVVNDYSGNQLISAPQLQITLNLTWPLVSERLGTFTPSYDLSWTDDVPFDANRGRGQRDLTATSRYSPYTLGNRAYALHNVRLAYKPPGDPSVEFSGWCRNVTDQRYDNFSVDLTNFAQVQLHYPSEPRSCGADVRFTW